MKLKKAVKSILKNIIDNDPRILKEPAPAVVVTGLVDNGVTIAVRPWVNRSDFWDVHSDVLERAKSQLYETFAIKYIKKKIPS